MKMTITKQRNNDAMLRRAIIFFVAILVFLIVGCTPQQPSSTQMPVSDSQSDTTSPSPSIIGIDGIDLKEECPDIKQITGDILETKLEITVANSNECKLLIKDENQKIRIIDTYKKCVPVIKYDGSRYDWNKYKEDKIKNLKVKEFSGPPISEVSNYFYSHLGFATLFDFEDPRLYKPPEDPRLYQGEYVCVYRIEAISREVSASAYTDELELEARTKVVSRLAKRLVPFMLTLGAATSDDISAETSGESAQPMTTNCGSDQACFEEKFTVCQPASVEITLIEGLTYRYEILGSGDVGCRVKSKFVANPNPAFVGPEMICNYDNSQDFGTAIQDMGRCEGELYSLMTGG